MLLILLSDTMCFDKEKPVMHLNRSLEWTSEGVRLDSLNANSEMVLDIPIKDYTLGKHKVII